MPKYTISQKLHDQLGRIIAQAQDGEQLPSEPKLAASLNVSRATLREAMRAYESQGLIRRHQGSGTFITKRTAVIDTGLEILESIETMAQRIGLSVNMGECDILLRNAFPDDLEYLNIAPESQVTSISRVILADNRPVAYLVDVLPAVILPPNELGDGFTGSVLDFLLKKGNLNLERSRTEINAVTATIDVARALGIQRGDVLLRFVSLLYTRDGSIIDYSQSYFLPGYFRFHVVRRVQP